MNSLRQCLLNHPAARLDRFFIQAQQRQNHDHGGGPVTAGGRPAVDQTANDFPQQPEVQRIVFHVVDNIVGPGAGLFFPRLIAAVTGGVINGLATLEQLNALVDPRVRWS